MLAAKTPSKDTVNRLFPVPSQRQCRREYFDPEWRQLERREGENKKGGGRPRPWGASYNKELIHMLVRPSQREDSDSSSSSMAPNCFKMDDLAVLS